VGSNSSKFILFIGLVAACLGAASCGGSQEVVTGPTDDGQTTEDSGRRRSGMGVESEIGALDEGQVKATFKRIEKQLAGCYERGTGRVPYLAGEIAFKIRVNKEGKVRWVYVKDSSLGDHDTESCMVRVLKGASWPSPIDGQDGITESSFAFEPGGDERMPLSWSPEQLGPKFKDAQGKLSQCRTDAGTGPLKATLYIDTDGKPGSIGVSSSDEKGDAAISCVIETLNGLTFPSPGSYASKVTVTIE
jgi:hypothetical protein